MSGGRNRDGERRPINATGSRAPSPDEGPRRVDAAYDGRGERRVTAGPAQVGPRGGVRQIDRNATAGAYGTKDDPRPPAPVGPAVAFVASDRRAIDDVADPEFAFADRAGEAGTPAAAKPPECLHRSLHSTGSPETFAR